MTQQGQRAHWNGEAECAAADEKRTGTGDTVCSF